MVWAGLAAAQSVAESDISRRPAPAQRIVSLAPHANELDCSRGLGERIVGADESSSQSTSSAQDITTTGGVSGPSTVCRTRLGVMWR